MNKKIAIIIALFIVSVFSVVAGNFQVDYPLGTTHFLVSTDGDTNATNLNVLTKLDAALASNVYFATDAISESYLDFDTSCGAGNHLYISGNDLACEANPGGMGVGDYEFMLWNATEVNTTYLRKGTTADTKWCIANGNDGIVDCNVEPVVDTDTHMGYDNIAMANETWFNASYLQEDELDTIAELNTQIADVTSILYSDTLSDGKWCVTTGTAGDIDCNVEPVSGSDYVLKAGDTMTGNLNVSTANITLDQFSMITHDTDTPSSYFTIDASGNVIIVLS